MKLLILGGTIFLGRALTLAALEQGHEVTLFTRGQHNPDLFPDTEKLIGDRDGNLTALAGGRRWDAVIDTCGYVPRIVRQSAELLNVFANHYTFISSISVYSDVSSPGVNEDGATGVLEDPTTEKIDGATYGPLKVLCEQEALNAFSGRCLVIRPGLIVGPHDPSDRFTYWPLRAFHGGEILTPANHAAPVQIIDVRDLAEWTIRMVEAGVTGVYNATGPDYTMTLGEMLQACIDSANGPNDAQLVPIDEAWLTENEVQPWSDVPTWVPDTGDYAGFSRVDCSRAITKGLTFRPIREIAADTLAWAQTREDNSKLKAGLTPEREEELLSRWHKSRI